MNKQESLLKFLNCGLEFTTPIIVGALLGIFIDKKYNTLPLFLVVFLILGCLAGYLNMKRYIERN